jgi:5-methylcytosine-specific restriction endonuclease McrA
MKRDPVCKIDDCTSKTYGHGYCSMHYARWKRNGDPKTTRKAANGTYSGKSCLLPDCDLPVKMFGYCNVHGLRFKRYGDPAYPTRISAYGEALCKVHDCTRSAKAKGFCTKHYTRWVNNGDPHKVLRRASYEGSRCQFDGCNGLAHSRNYCRPHYQRVHSEVFNLLARRRKLRQRTAPRIPYTADDVLQKMSYWGNRCWMCSAAYQQVDHFKPLSKGGGDILANLRPACKSCNSKKKDKWFGVVGTRDHFLGWRERQVPTRSSRASHADQFDIVSEGSDRPE